MVRLNRVSLYVLPANDVELTNAEKDVVVIGVLGESVFLQEEKTIATTIIAIAEQRIDILIVLKVCVYN
jgi:hypothetical protein